MQLFINNNINNIKFPSSSIKIDFPKPQLIGLQNVGATCCMNATLQCFCQIEDLVNYFKYKPYINEDNSKYKKNDELCLTTSFKYLVENLWPSVYDYINNKYNHKNSNNKYFAPYKFKETISKMNPLFAEVRKNNSKDLVVFIIMTLHEELNKAKKNPVSNKNFQSIDQTNKQLIFNNYIENFENENKSIISDIFYGINLTSFQCSNCKITTYNYQTFSFLFFSLEEIKKYKKDLITNQLILINQNTFNINNPQLFKYNINLKNVTLNIDSVDINDCFEYNKKMKQLHIYCNRCKGIFPALYCTQLYTIPEILIIVLNREKENYLNVKLDFYEDLNLQNFVEVKEVKFKYNLIGVVSFIGESIDGKFIAFCKSPIDNQWYKYNDDIVSKVVNFNDEIIKNSLPYILFYQKCK